MEIDYNTIIKFLSPKNKIKEIKLNEKRKLPKYFNLTNFNYIGIENSNLINAICNCLSTDIELYKSIKDFDLERILKEFIINIIICDIDNENVEIKYKGKYINVFKNFIILVKSKELYYPVDCNYNRIFCYKDIIELVHLCDDTIVDDIHTIINDSREIKVNTKYKKSELNKKKKQELIDLANELELDFDKKIKKIELINLILSI